MNSPLQEAAACGLEQAKARAFFETQTQEYLDRRDVLIAAFRELGLKYTTAEGACAKLGVISISILQVDLF